MYDNDLRHLKDWITTPICRTFPAWISPNLITLAAFTSGLFAVGSVALSASSSSPWPLALWLLNRVLDALDGTLARTRGATTALGSFLDLLGDFIIYSSIPAMIAYGEDRRTAGASTVDWRAVALLEATFHINNFVLFYISAVMAPKPDKDLTTVAMRPALIEGMESGLIFSAMFVWPQYLTWICWAMSLAVVVGIVQRVYFAIHLLRRLDKLPGKA